MKTRRMGKVILSLCSSIHWGRGGGRGYPRPGQEFLSFPSPPICPFPSQDRGTIPFTPSLTQAKGWVPSPLPGQDRGIPPSPPPPAKARTVVRCGQYASCVHAGRLSCKLSLNYVVIFAPEYFFKTEAFTICMILEHDALQY